MITHTEIEEPHKVKHALQSALILGSFFAVLLFSDSIGWSSPPAAVRVSLIPSIPVPPPPPPPEPEVITEKPEPKPEPEPVAEPEPTPTAAEVVRAEEEKKREEEEKKRKEEQKKRDEEKKRKEEEKKRKEEQKKRDEEKKRKEEEKKRKAEEEKKRKEEEKKRKAEEEKKRKEEEKKRKEAEEQARLQAEAAAQEAARQKALEQRASRIADKYASLIISRIRSYLKTPTSVPLDSDIVVIVEVTLNPDGSLNGIPQVAESSGFPEYDDAAVRAVLQAAPLPIPKERFIAQDQKLMQQFLQHRLYIRPTL